MFAPIAPTRTTAWDPWSVGPTRSQGAALPRRRAGARRQGGWIDAAMAGTVHGHRSLGAGGWGAGDPPDPACRGGHSGSPTGAGQQQSTRAEQRRCGGAGL